MSWRRGKTVILTQSSSDHSSTSSSSWLGCSTVGQLRAQRPLSATGSHAGILSPTDSNSNWNWPKPSVAPGYIILFTNPYSRAGYDSRSIFKRSFTGFNSEFSFSKTSCLNKAEELSLSYYLPIAGRRIIGFIPFLRVLVLCEMQSVSSRIWTRVAVSISYDDNHYSTDTAWSYNCLTSTCFRSSSAYLHRCISWLTARSRVNI